MEQFNIHNITSKLETDGVVIIKSVYTIKQIEELKLIATEKYKYVNENIHNMIPEIYNYYTHFNKENCVTKNYYNCNNLKIIEITKGRYDIGFSTNIKINPIINKVINHFIKKQKITEWGLLTSDINSNNGPWHRDTININGDADENGNYDDSVMVHYLQPFYFTILIPLVPLNKTNGTTEFIKGSHKLTYDEAKEKEHIRIDTNIGDIIIFDGRIFHRGRENNSNEKRPILYNIVHRSWYIDMGI
jgi:ectoine hydroxylase-related dioxygenase (phytanoyl-CoA dioxygenase family)